LRGVQLLLLAIALGALAVRLTLRDGLTWSAWTYYSTPLPVIAAVFVLAALASLATGARRTAMLCVLGGLLCASGWMFTDYRTHECVASNDEIRVAMWNVSRKTRNGDAIADIGEMMRPFDPHVIGLVEAGPSTPEHVARWRSAFPGYTVVMPRENLAVLWKGDIGRYGAGELDGISQYADVVGTIEQLEVRLVLVDLDASPRFDKQRIVPEVFRIAGEGDTRTTIVMGDFNTPLDSTAFVGARSRFQHAFEESGRGLPATWPSRVPLQSIDHVWLSSDLTPTCTTLVASRGYDHKQVRVRVSRPSAYTREDLLQAVPDEDEHLVVAGDPAA